MLSTRPARGERILGKIPAVPLLLEHRRVGDVTVVTCRGRIVEGAESIALQQLLDDLLPYSPHLILHLGGIDFIDSSGLGLLVRCVNRTRNAHCHLAFCALSPQIVDVLEVTRLRPVFESYASEAEAITARYQRVDAGARSSHLRTDILCVDASADVQAYVRELLGRAGYDVLTASNLPDGLILLQATRTKLVIVNPDLRQARGTRSADRFNTLADTLKVIELPADFSRKNAGDAGQRLLDQVRAISVT
jgi:anti-anti-sigma factor